MTSTNDYNPLDIVCFLLVSKNGNSPMDDSKTTSPTESSRRLRSENCCCENPALKITEIAGSSSLEDLEKSLKEHNQAKKSAEVRSKFCMNSK